MPESPSVTLAVDSPYYHGEYDPSIEGVSPITREGTDVPADAEKEIRASAKHHGVTIRVVR